MKCDVFISYRRDGGDMTALYLYQALKERGYDVFYDLEVLRAGKFNEALLEYIGSCQDFLLVLSPHALDRCTNENDWVRLEIAEAMRLKKNIVPVIMNGFAFPNELPEEIDDIRYQNGLAANTEYFQESMTRLCSRYLTAKPRKKMKKPLIAALAASAVVAAVGGWFLFAGQPGAAPAQPAPIITEAPEPAAEPAATVVTVKPLMQNDNLPAGINESGMYELAPVFGNNDIYRKQIHSVTFLSSLADAGEGAWDVSYHKDGSVLAWVKSYGSEYELYIAGEGGVAFSSSIVGDYSMFAGYINMVEIRFNGCVDTSQMDNAVGMFSNCRKLRTLDLTGWDTSGIVAMNGMFEECSNLQELILPDGFVTNRVDSMYLMFTNCEQLKYVNTIGWDTSSVQDMRDIFVGCKALGGLNMSHWRLDNIQNRPVIRFDPLQDGISYDLTPVLGHETLTRNQVATLTFLPARVEETDDWWDVSAAGDGSVWAWTKSRKDGLFDLFIAADGGVSFPDASLYDYDGDDYPFFNSYLSLERIAFNHCVDFSALTTAHAMFEGCARLEEIDLTGMDFSGVQRFSGMFKDCFSLRRAILPSLVGGFANKLDWMFGNCFELFEIDMTGWNTSGLWSAQDMFNSCGALRELDLSGWDTSRLEYINGIFEHCTGLERVNVSSWITSRIHNMAAAFAFCGSLRELDLSGWDTSRVENMSSLFLHCSQMNNLILPDGFVGINTHNTKEMFSGCVTLSQINTTVWDTSGITDMSGMFQGCQSLTTLDQSGWVYHPEVDTTDLFLECYKLQGV